MSPTFVTLLAGSAGLCVGSFLNVCVLRWTAGDSVVAPRSHCRGCGARLRWFQALPVAGYLLVGGRCASCGVWISLQYPLAEIAAGLIWAGAAYQWGLHPEALRGAIFLTLLLGIALADARTYLIPDQFSLGGTGAGAATALLPGGLDLSASAVGALLGFSLMWVVAAAGRAVFRKAAVGGGDIKMMAMVGAFLGPAGVLVTLFAGALAGSLVFGPVSFRTGKLVPFGVFLALGAGVAYGWGSEIVGWYLQLVRL